MSHALFQWNYLNIQLGKCLFPELIHSPDFSWIMIPEFPLSALWNSYSTPLLIVQPGLNGDIFNCKPDHFYCDIRLRLANGDKHEHIFHGNTWNNLHNNGWARISWHIQNWKPSPDIIASHNLVSLLEGLDKFFREG